MTGQIQVEPAVPYRLAGKDNKRFLAGEPGLDRDGALFVAS